MNIFTMEDVIKTCSEIGIICISTEYKTIKDPLVFICTNCGKEFERNYENLKNRRKTVCWDCGKSYCEKPTRYSYEYVKKYIEEDSNSGCELLSTEYSNIDRLLTIKCACGNTFEKTFYRFKNRNMTRCPECSNKLLSQANALPKEKIQKSVNDAGYVFLDNKLEGKDQKILVQCQQKHEPYWVTVSKFNRGRRCPHCARSLGEEKITMFLKNNKICFKPEYKFNDLIGVGGGKLRYDFGILDEETKELLFLIEYDGLQHYEVSFNSPLSFEITQIHDEMKNDYVNSHNLILYRIPYTDYENIEEILSSIFIKRTERE